MVLALVLTFIFLLLTLIGGIQVAFGLYLFLGLILALVFLFKRVCA